MQASNTCSSGRERATVRMRKLGRTGIEVSAYCLGTMVFGTMGNPDHDGCVRMVHRALDAGIDFLDTADVYGYSETEEIAGKALKGRRDEVVLATQFNGPMGQEPNRCGSSRRWVVQAVEGSLKRLQTEYIDLYQIHHPDPHTDIEETLSALTDLVRAGKVRAIGSSNLPASEIVEAQWVSQRRGLHRLRTEQPPLLHSQPRHRAGDPARLPPLRLGRSGVEPAGHGPAHWPLPQETDIGPLDVSYTPPSLPHSHGPAPTPVPRASRRVRMP